MVRLDQRSAPGKLIAAARHWAGIGSQERAAALADARDLLKSLQGWNAGPEQIEPVQREIERLQGTEDFEVHEDNMESVGVFLGLQTQWRTAATFGGIVFLGLDYAAAESLMRMRRVQPQRRAEIFCDLQVMEGAALDAMAAQSEAARTAPAAPANQARTH